jgi:hypothetical protein
MGYVDVVTNLRATQDSSLHVVGTTDGLCRRGNQPSGHTGFFPLFGFRPEVVSRVCRVVVSALRGQNHGRASRVLRLCFVLLLQVASGVRGAEESLEGQGSKWVRCKGPQPPAIIRVTASNLTARLSRPSRV